MTEIFTADQPGIDIREILKQRNQIAIIWGIEDVQQVRPDLTDGQAWDVLEACEDDHDANEGISWETLEAAAEDLFPESDE